MDPLAIFGSMFMLFFFGFNAENFFGTDTAGLATTALINRATKSFCGSVMLFGLSYFADTVSGCHNQTIEAGGSNILDFETLDTSNGTCPWHDGSSDPFTSTILEDSATRFWYAPMQTPAPCISLDDNPMRPAGSDPMSPEQHLDPDAFSKMIDFAALVFCLLVPFIFLRWIYNRIWPSNLTQNNVGIQTLNVNPGPTDPLITGRLDEILNLVRATQTRPGGRSGPENSDTHNVGIDDRVLAAITSSNTTQVQAIDLLKEGLQKIVSQGSSGEDIEQRVDRRLQERMSVMQSSSEEIEQRVDRRLQEKMSELKSSSDEIEQRLHRRLQDRMSAMQSYSTGIEQRVDRRLQERMSELSSSEEIEQRVDRRLQERMSELQSSSDEINHRIDKIFQEKISEVQTSSEGIEHKFDRRLQERISEIQEPSEDMRRRLETLEERDKVSENEVKGISEQIRQLQDSENASIQDVRGEVEKQKQAAEARISAFFEKFEKSVTDQIKKYNEKKAGELQALVEGKLEQVRNEASKAPAPAVDEKTLKDLEKRITGVRTQMSEVSHTSKELKEWCDGLDFKIQQYDENLTIAKDIRDSVRSLTSQVGKTQEQVTALSASKGDTQRLTEQLSQRLGQLETISAMPEKVQDLNQKLEEIQQVQRQHAPAVSKLENDVQEFDKRLTSQVTKMDEKFQEKSSSQDKSLSKLRQRVSKVETKQGESEGRTQEVSKEEVEKLLKESYDKLKNELEQELKLLDFPHFASRLHNLSNRFDNIEETVTERVKQISSQEGDLQKDFKKDLEEDLKKGLRVDLEKDLREDLEKDLVEMSIRLDIVESERENHAVRLGQIDERDTQTQADIKQLISTMEGHEKSHEQKILELQWHHSRNITGFESSLRSTAEEIRGKFDTLLKAIYGNNTVATNQPLVEHLQALQRNHTALWDMLRASDQKAKMTVDSQTTEPIQQNTSTVPRSSSVPQPNSGNRPIPMTPPGQQPATITDQMNIDQQTPILAQPNVPVPQHSLVHQPTLTSPSNPVPQTTPARQTATTIDRMSINELLTSEPIQQHVPTVPRSNLNPQNNLANLLTQYQPTSSAQQAAPVQQTATTTGQMSIEEQRILTYIQPQVSGTVQSSLVSQPYPVNQFYSRQQTPAQQAAPVPWNPAPTDQMNIDQQNPVPVQSHGLTAPQYSPTFQSSISGRADISSQPPPAQQTTAVPITPTTQSTFDFASPPLPSETNVPTFRPKAKPKGRLQSRQAQNALQHEKDKVIYESAAIPNSAEIDPGLDDVEARAAAQELRAAAQESSHIQGRSSDRSGVLPLTPGYRHAADMPYNPGQLEVSQATQTSSHIQGQPLIQSRGAVPEEQQNVAPIAETSNPVTTSGQQKVTSQTTSKASPTSETSLGDSQRATKQSNVVPQHQATSHPVETSAKQQEAPQVVKQGSSQSQGVSGQQQATSNLVRELSTGEKTRETSEKSVPGQSLSESQPAPSKPKKVQWGATVSVKQKELTEQDHFARDTIHEWFGSLETKPMSSSRWAVPEESKDTPPKTEAASKPVESSGKQEKTTQAIQQPPSDSQAKPLGESRPAPSEESKDTPPKTEIASKPVETPGRQEEKTQAIQPRPSNSQVKPLDESRPAPSEEKKKDTPPRTEEASKAVETSRRQDTLHSQEKSLGESQGTISKQKKDTVPWGASVSVKQKELTEEDRFITNALRDAFGSLNTRPMSASRWAVSEESEDTPPGEAAGTRPTKESSEKEKVAHDASKETSTNTPKPLLGQSRWATSEEQQVATPPRNEPGKSPAGGSGRKGMAGDNEAAKDLGQEPISAEQDDMALEDEGDPFADVVEEVVFFDEL